MIQKQKESAAKYIFILQFFHYFITINIKLIFILKMKHNIFKIRKLGEPIETKELSQFEGQNKKNSQIDNLKTTVLQTNEKMVELMNLFQTFMKTSIQQTAAATNQTNTSSQLTLVEREVRDRHVLLPMPQIQKLSKEEAQKWLTQVCIATFSTSFHYYLTQQMTFEQTKVFCSENILRNLLQFTQKFKLTDIEIQNLNRHIGQKVLQYLQKKYPLTQSNDVNKALQKQVQETNHLDLLVNDFLYNSGIMFEYSSDGNYNNMIMKVINKAMESSDQISLFANLNEENKKLDEQVSNYNDFQTFMSEMFESVYDEEWMIGSKTKASRIDSEATYIAKKVNAESHKEKYEEKVKGYTNYLIGRKISQNTVPYSESEIKSKNLIIKSPAILRILTKWCQQLWQKFENETYFTERTESLQLQNPQIINPFFKWMKTGIDKLACDQKKNILAFKAELDRNNFNQQAQFLQKHLLEDSITNIPKYQKASGKFATHMVKNLHSYITLYLNRLIHGLLTVSKNFYEKQIDKSWDDWQSPPNLITFKIGDLLRCRISSKQKEIVKIFKEIKNISNSNPKRLKIVRIKNRLKLGTNDILINIKFNNLIICEIQLEVINKSKSKFIQCSNSFSHYIYEMKRSIFGPISELCNIWNNFQARSSQYQSLINFSKLQEEIKKQGCKDNSQHLFVKFDLPFQCSFCQKLYYHNNFIIPNKKCEKCSKYKCVKCQISNWGEAQLKKEIFKSGKNKKISQSSKKSLLKTIPKVGVCVKIQSSSINIQIFQLCKYEGKTWLLGKQQNQLYNIKMIKTPKDTQEFLDKYCIFQITTNPSSFINVTDKMTQNFAMEQYVKESYKQQKQVLILTQIRYSVPEMKELMKIDGGYERNKKKIKRLEFASNYLNDISYFSCFENVTTINLDYNHFQNMLEIGKFKFLEKLEMRENQKLVIFNDEVCALEKLEEMKLSNCQIASLPQKIGDLTLLNSIKMDKNRIKALPESICNITNLKQMSFKNNGLTTLPQNIGKLVNLKKLHLAVNSISELPKSIGQLSSLQILDLSKNKLKELPENLLYLSKLQTFKLEQNQLTSIPPNLLSNQALKILTLNGNKLGVLPNNFNGCKNLQSLTLHNNLIEELPQSLNTCILLSQLTLYKNKLKEVPKWFSKFKRLSPKVNFKENSLKQFPQYLFEDEVVIHEILLDTNEIEAIPKEIKKLEELTTLTLNQNKIKQIAPELAELKQIVKLQMKGNEIEHVPLIFKQIETVKKNVSKWSTFLTNNKVSSFQSPQLFDLMGNEIELTNNWLASIPIALLNHKATITTLNFSNNKIKQIPREIKLFTSLTQLLLANNEIELVPKQVEQLANLSKQFLTLDNNPLKQVECLEFCLQFGHYLTVKLIKALSVVEQKPIPPPPSNLNQPPENDGDDSDDEE